MYERLEECPSCKHTKFQNYLICKDYTVSSESFALVKCTKCGLVLTNPRPDEDNIAAYYASPDYISHTNKANSLTDKMYLFVRHYAHFQKKRLIIKYTKGKNLLDFGCGTGHFATYMQRNGYNVTGYETAKNASILAESSLGTPIIGSLKELKKQELKYDVITGWHVLEHVHQLRQTVKALRKQLTKNGVLILAVPNYLSHDSVHFKEQWAGYDVPRHLYHFNRDSMKELAKNTKLKIVKVLPMTFDSYYVSLLSTKYQLSSPDYMKAFKIGFQSNRKAKKTGEYSSLIYVLRK